MFLVCTSSIHLADGWMQLSRLSPQLLTSPLCRRHQSFVREILNAHAQMSRERICRFIGLCCHHWCFVMLGQSSLASIPHSKNILTRSSTPLPTFGERMRDTWMAQSFKPPTHVLSSCLISFKGRDILKSPMERHTRTARSFSGRRPQPPLHALESPFREDAWRSLSLV